MNLVTSTFHKPDTKISNQHNQCKTASASGYTPRHSTDHGDGRISGDTMIVYIPWYEPESDINIFIKPSVINIQPLMEVQ